MLQTERAKIEALNTMVVEASGNRFPRTAALFDSGGDAVLCTQAGQYRQQAIWPRGWSGYWSVVDERVSVVHHVAVLNILGTDEEGTLRQPSPYDGVVRLLLARTLDDEPDGDVINGPNRVSVTSKVT